MTIELIDYKNINPNRLIPLYLMSSYLYYRENVRVLSDTQYDEVCEIINVLWDRIDHPNKWLVEREAVACGTGRYLKEEDYPNMIKGAARHWHRNSTR